MLEPGSEVAEDLWNAADIATSTLLVYPEARAAVARASRTRRLNLGAVRETVAELDRFCEELRLIRLDTALARHAGDLAERHALTGYDAVHLASALSLEDDNAVIATWGRELGAAAVAAGRAVVPAP